MESKILIKNLEFLERSLKRERGFRFALIVLVGIMTLAFLLKANTTKTILVPFGTPNSQTLFVEDELASKEYLKLTAEKFSSLLLTFSPAYAQQNMEKVLLSVAPENYAVMNKATIKKLAEIKKNNVSSVFYPQQTSIDTAGSRVVITGLLKTFSSDKIVVNEKRSYLFGFKVVNSQLQLSQFVDVTGVRQPLKNGKYSPPNEDYEQRTLNIENGSKS